MFYFATLSFGAAYLYFSCFRKKLVCLLSLELLMIILISNFLVSGLGSLGSKTSFFSFVFLSFMVLDSTLGISFLICSSRCSFSILQRNLI